MTIPSTSQNPQEFNFLLEIYKKAQPRKILEIGTHEGGTLYYWLKYALTGAKVCSIDLQGMISDKQAQYWAADGVTAKCLKANSSSSEAVQWALREAAPVDFLFIDGGHAYDEVRSDWEEYGRMVKPGGIVAFHDILPHEPYQGQMIEVDRLWSEIKELYETEEIVFAHDEWGIGPGIGVVYL